VEAAHPTAAAIVVADLMEAAHPTAAATVVADLVEAAHPTVVAIVVTAMLGAAVVDPRVVVAVLGERMIEPIPDVVTTLDTPEKVTGVVLIGVWGIREMEDVEGPHTSESRMREGSRIFSTNHGSEYIATISSYLSLFYICISPSLFPSVSYFPQLLAFALRGW